MKLTRAEITPETLRPLVGLEMIVLLCNETERHTGRQIAPGGCFGAKLRRLSPSGEYAEFISSGLGPELQGWIVIASIQGIETLADKIDQAPPER